MDRLQEIKERECKATEGPWEVIGATEVSKTGPYWATIAGVYNLRPTKTPDDSLAKPEPAIPGNSRFRESCRNADFIAHSREDIPWLIRELEAARKKLKASIPHHEVVRCICEEPEVPGRMLDAMWNAISGDRDATENAIRIAVRQTKSEILMRVEALQSPKEPK